MLCHEVGERWVKDESGMKSDMIPELRLMKAVVAAGEQKLLKSFGCSMNTSETTIRSLWTDFFAEELALTFQPRQY